MEREQTLAAGGLRINSRLLLYLLALTLGAFVLAPRLIGFQKTLSLLSGAQLDFILVAVVCETLRYLVSAASTYVLARLFNRPAPISPLVGAFFAGAAANRACSIGGAPSMTVRALVLMRHRLALGSVGVLFLVEDLAGLVVGGVALLIAIPGLLSYHAGNLLAVKSAAGLLIGTLILITSIAFFYRRRSLFERGVHLAVAQSSVLCRRVLHRSFYDPARLQRLLDDFYSGIAASIRRPRYALLSLLLNAVRFILGAAVMFFCFRALNWNVPLDSLILMFTAASVISTISAVPGEAAIVGGGFLLIALSAGIPKEAAMVALLLSRAISFWLPIPVGVVAFEQLRRSGRL